MSANERKGYYIFSPWTRIFHWVMATTIFTLFATGLYIGNPFFIGTQGIEPTYAFDQRLSMETIRFIHFAAAYILTAAFILRIYGFIVNKGDRLLPKFWTTLYWQGLKDTLLHYLFIRSSHEPYLRNSLARTTYLGVYVLIILEAITGFAMYFMIDPNSLGARIFGPFIPLFGGEYMVHVIHHYLAWFFVIFVIGHIYMVIRADFMEKEGEISSMFSGVKYYAHEPLDIGDIKDDKKQGHCVGHREHTVAG